MGSWHQGQLIRPIHMPHQPFFVCLAVPSLGRQADQGVGEKLHNIRVDFRGDWTKMNELAVAPGWGYMFSSDACSGRVEVLNTGTPKTLVEEDRRFF